MNPFHERQRETGFTLVEISVVMLFSLIALGALAGIFDTIEEVRATDETRMRLGQATRVASHRMISELRRARSFLLADDDALEFEFDGDPGLTSLRYYYHDPGGDREPPFYLYRAENFSSPGDGQPLVTLMEASWTSPRPAPPDTPRVEFVYRDASGSALSRPLSAGDLDRIRTIEITLNVENLEEGSGPPEPRVQILRRFHVTPRMLR